MPIPLASRLLTTAAALAACAPAFAQAGAAGADAGTGAQAQLRQRALAATCAACHGADGHAPAGSAMPSLAGRPAAEIAQQMQSFRSGAREATLMHQIARGYSEAQIQDLAAFFAAQRP